MRSWPAFVLLACAVAPAGAQPNFMSGASPLGDFTLPVETFLDRRFAEVIRQRYDFSCGSAALATLLRYGYGYRVREDDAFRGMWDEGDRDQIRRLGFSLLDMKRWLASEGLAADGYKVSLEEVAQTGLPGIVMVTTQGYRHFVVVKGITGSEVLLGDPSAGLSVMPRGEFEKAWNGVYFVLNGETDRGKQSFNRERQWRAFARAPANGIFTRPLSDQALALSTPFFRDL